LFRYYEEVKIKKDTFFENYYSYIKHEVEKEMSSVGEPVDKNEWGMTPQVRPAL
jgi:predicted metalloendopeptidase